MEGVYLQAPTLPFQFGSSFCLPAFALLFQVFFLRKKTHTHTQRKKTIKKKKNVKKGESSPSNSRFTLSLLVPTYAFLLLYFHFKRFLLASSSFQAKEKKKNTKEKKTINKKKCKEGKELTFKLPLYPLIFGSYFYPSVSTLSFQALSLGIFFFSNKRKKKLKKNHIE